MLKKILSQEPRCPFCDQPFSKPVLEEPVKLADFEKGRCVCGAVYIYDITGHNLGAAYIELLSYIANEDWNLAWQLVPDTDYREARIENYDINKHLIQPTGRDEQGRRTRGVLIFMKLDEEIEEISKERKIKTGQEYVSDTINKPLIRKKHSKLDVNKAFDENNIEKLTEMAIQDSLVIRKLQQKLYSAEPIIRWRAILAIGVISGKIIKHSPTVVGDLVRRLVYAVNDSAAASWGAVETICEIIRNNPRIFAPFLTQALSYLSDENSRKAVLWGIGRINEKEPDLIKNAPYYSIYNLIKSDDPEVRGLTLFALGKLSLRISFDDMKKLQKDIETFEFFDGKELIKISVSEMLKKIFEEKKMEQPNETDIKRNEALKLYEEGLINFNRGMTLDAIKSLEQAAAICEELQDEAGIANCAEKIGDSMLVRGNFTGAIAQYQRALAMCEKHNDPLGIVILIEKLVDIFRKQGEFDNVLSYSFYALEKLESAGDSGRAAMFISTIGDTFEKQGKIDEALDAYRLAHNIFRGMGSGERADILERGIKVLEERAGKDMPK